jgi:hypothetical protein
VKILAIQALRGPNFWSNDVPKLIQSRLDLSEQNKLKEQVWENFLVQNSLLVDWIFQLRTQSDNDTLQACFFGFSTSKKGRGRS